MTFTVTIPSSLERNTSSSLTIGYEINRGDLAMLVSSSNFWKLINGLSEISYNLNKTSWVIPEGTGVDSVTVNLAGIPSSKGAHNDTLTFTYEAN